MRSRNVHQWLESSQQNAPYELDFFTPFKDMVGPDKPARDNRRPTKRKHTRSESPQPQLPIVVSSDRDTNSTTSSSSSSSSQTYKRRPRHKTREDRYEYKGSKNHDGKIHNSRKTKTEITRHKKQKRRVKKDVIDNFMASNVLSNRLSLNKPAGMFRRGKASFPATRPGVPDLKFSERAFLNLNLVSGLGRDDEGRQRESTDARRAERRDKKQKKQDAKMSEYFRQPPLAQDRTPPAQAATGTGNRPNILQTPCPRRPVSPELGSEPLMNVPLPGPAFLGFGEKGPDPAPSSSLRRIASLTPTSEQSHHRPGARHLRFAPKTADTTSNLSQRLETTSVFTTDPRAKHSPTSNFQFARTQQERSQRARHDRYLRTTRNSNSDLPDRQDEIITLLRQLQERAEGKNSEKENSLPNVTQPIEAVEIAEPSKVVVARKLMEHFLANCQSADEQPEEQIWRSLNNVIHSIEQKLRQAKVAEAEPSQEPPPAKIQSDKPNHVPSPSTENSSNAASEIQSTSQGPTSKNQKLGDHAADRTNPTTAMLDRAETSPGHEPHTQADDQVPTRARGIPPSRPESTHREQGQVETTVGDDICQDRSSHPGISSLPAIAERTDMKCLPPVLVSRPRIIQLARGPGLYEQQMCGPQHGQQIRRPISRPGTGSTMSRPSPWHSIRLLNNHVHSPRQHAFSPHSRWGVALEMSYGKPQGGFGGSSPSDPLSQPLPALFEPQSLEECGGTNELRPDVETWKTADNFAESASVGRSQYDTDYHEVMSPDDFRSLDNRVNGGPTNDSATPFSQPGVFGEQPDHFGGAGQMQNFWKPNVLY